LDKANAVDGGYRLKVSQILKLIPMSKPQTGEPNHFRINDYGLLFFIFVFRLPNFAPERIAIESNMNRFHHWLLS
jgi:hypothetical protein